MAPDSPNASELVNALVHACLEPLREQRLCITPLCAAFFLYREAHPETHDLLSPLGLRLYSD